MGETGVFLFSVLGAAIQSGTPLLFAVLGTILVERSGVMNLGLEGLMLVGALAGFAAASVTSNLLLAILFAMMAGALLGLLHALFCVVLRINQVVSGLAITLLGSGITGLWGTRFAGTTAARFVPVKLPLLGDIPVLGQIFFGHDVLVYVALGLVPLLWFFLYRTRFGMNLRAVGEEPRAADSRGIDVYRVRFLYTIGGSAITALGGAYLSLAANSLWMDNLTAGRGWIAIALALFAGWDPVKALLGATLFGGISALGFHLQAFGVPVSPYLLKMLPYLLTIGVLALTSSERSRRKLGTPSSLGIPYSREERM